MITQCRRHDRFDGAVDLNFAGDSAERCAENGDANDAPDRGPCMAHNGVFV